ncbi:MAG: DUF885 family protein [Clostridiales bacterium]|jgi:hypothetical protein|nr:DUF885 family protein [Clostridiales bacterium]
MAMGNRQDIVEARLNIAAGRRDGASGDAGQRAAGGAGAYGGLAERYRAADLACARLHYRLRGAGMYERGLPLPVESERAGAQEQLGAACDLVRSLPAPEPVFALLRRHFEDFLGAQEFYMRNYFSKPEAAVGELALKMMRFAGGDSRSDEEKAGVMMAQLACVPELLAAARRMAERGMAAGARERAAHGEAGQGRRPRELGGGRMGAARPAGAPGGQRGPGGAREGAGADFAGGEALAREAAHALDCFGHYGSRLGEYFPALARPQARELGAAIGRAAGSLRDLSEWLGGQPPQGGGSAGGAASGTAGGTAGGAAGGTAGGAAGGMAGCAPCDDRRAQFDGAYYRSVLRDSHGVELDELLAWHEGEIEKTRGQALEIAARLPVARAPRTMRECGEALFEHAGACGSPQEMFERSRGYMARAREAARGYVSFPQEECRLERVPYPLRESYPWGGYADGDGRQRRPITGTAFLNERNYRAVSDGWLKMQALHEAYPGHHLQYVRSVADTLPETLKLGAKHTPLVEGAAHRSEQLFAFVFGDDPFYPLFAAFRRHHTAVRVKIDLMLRYFGEPVGSAVRLYQDELGFDAETARGQVLAHEQMEGYFTCYCYGARRIAELEGRSGAGAREFTETLFSCGNMSMENFAAYLALDGAQRASFRADFRSLLMLGESGA